MTLIADEQSRVVTKHDVAPEQYDRYVHDQIEMHKHLADVYTSKRYAPRYSRMYQQYWNRRLCDLARLEPGSRVLDLGCGAGFDTLQAAMQVGPAGKVIAVDMTPAMLSKTRSGAAELGLGQIEARLGYAESLPLEDGSVGVVISNGVINLCPDKMAVMKEINRVLRPGGRLVAVEPWRTPFLDLVHFVSELPPVRRVWGRMDAFATMSDYERVTYEAGLGMPEPLLAVVDRFFEREQVKIGFGKLRYVGRRCATPAPPAA